MVQIKLYQVGFHLPPDAVSSRREVQAASKMFQVAPPGYIYTHWWNWQVNEEDVSGFRYCLYKAVVDSAQL